ncbi:Fpg/Nei family DNA glycosylase [Marivita hallyeonensis]|uniref:Formamidopyrimidine-DNA glycosylase n=1 Tax=Marivita hallyeonensis TaxID=996342 RepID=A0A1M5UV47_9RHOB|nr:DNA-formamidopyrimidine glycosylase family protein [Marivita hallyeonensis]SHH66872.1 formamidopyrimidine-DNA glycosylase [Marivita hallyeonensis]
MPELPECEAARKRIADGALNRTIEGFSLGEVSHVELPSEEDRARFIGTQFTRTRRHGKYIFIGSKDGPWLHIHLGMAGSVRVMENDADLADYIRFTVEFEGGTRLHFRDPRKFGKVTVVEDVDDFIADKGLGPDALEIGDNAFADTIGKTRGAVKSALLSQKKLAGVGNLWADETLYRTGIDPDATANTLEQAKVSEMHANMQSILQAVVDTNATYAKLPDDWLIHHREEGEACSRCDGTIAKKTVGGRTSYYCPEHQAGAS